MKEEIRALSFGEILETSLQILRDHFALLVGVAATMYVPVAIATGLFATPPPGETFPEFTPEAIFSLVAAMIYASVLWPIVAASLAYTIAEIYRGRSVTIAEALARGWKLILPLSATAVVQWTLVLFGFLLIVPGIYLLVVWVQWTNVAVLENTFGYAALRRSADLVQGYRLRAAGLFAVTLIAGWALAAIESYTLGYVPGVALLADGLVQSVGVAFGTVVFVVMYFDLRGRKEHFDIEDLETVSPAV